MKDLARRPGLRVGALVTLANLMVAVLVGLSLLSSYRQYGERAAIVAHNTNRLVAQTIAGEIDRIDLGLGATADEVARCRRLGPAEEAGMDAFLARLHSRLPMVDVLGVLDAAGTLTHVAGPRRSDRVSDADRDYFLALRDNARLGLAISRPAVGRVSGKAVLVFARRIERPGGGFAGVVFASVAIDWFVSKFANLEVGPHGVVAMRGDSSRDFDLLARFPAAGFVGQTKVSDTFRATIAANPREGGYAAQAGTDDVRRAFSYQAVGDYPLITLVGLGTEDTLGAWWRDAAKLVSLAVIFTLATVLAGLTTARAWRALERQTADLARSNADLEQFAYVASHDLQTPLRSIISYTQLLARRYHGRLDGDADEFIGFIVDGAKQMSMLINDLLDYARIANLDRPRTAIPAKDGLDAAIAQLAGAIDETGARLTVATPLPLVFCDATQLISLFQNLIQNALRYRHPDRAPDIVVSARPEGDRMWRFAVGDNGIGIAPEYFDKVFVIFQRLEPAKFPGGTGIGLAQCRAIVSRLGGKIWLESEPGIGSTFLFTLPAAPGTER